jgi:hypothetical protein
MDHLLPEDGQEAIAVGLCGRYINTDKVIITLHDLTLIPHNECYTRGEDILVWPTERIFPYFDKIGKSDLAILKIHSHPGGFREFSHTDDISDKELFDSAFGWSINDKPHASAVMLPGGEIFGRVFFSDLHSEQIDEVTIAGDYIKSFQNQTFKEEHDFALRTIQAFGEYTFSKLRQMSVGVVGCSGTGSPVIEQLVRLGVGKLVLVDPDKVEAKNLNRILNTTKADADAQRPKVKVLEEAIKRIDIGTEVIPFEQNLYEDINALKSLVECDIIFGCMDSVDGRYLLNQLCTFYLIPYFDLGVKLEADGKGGIAKICGSVHYIQPGKSSLITRGLYTVEDLKAASQLRKNPEEYENLLKSAYIKNINVSSPAVISVNMSIASHAVNEFLNRIHSYKGEDSANYALSTIDITEGYIVNVNEDEFEVDLYLKKKLGRGDLVPYIEMPELMQ